MIALLAILLAQASPGRVLTLAEAQRMAEERQPQLRAARGSTEAAEGRVEQSRSGLLPQLSAASSWERTTNNFLFRPGVAARTGLTTSWSSINYLSNSVTLSQLVWDFGQTSNLWRSSQASVRTAFFNAVAFKELLAVARETLANQYNHRTQIRGFVQAGTRPPIDLSQAESDYAFAEVAVVNAVNAYGRSKVLLNQAMGLEAPIDYDVASDGLPPQADEDGSFEPLLQKALAARPEIASATEQVKAQQLLIRSARGSYAPSIALQGSFVQASEAGSNYSGWNVAGGVTLTWNLFQGGLTNGRVHEAEGNLAFAAAQLDVLRQQVRVDVDQALLAIRAAKAALASARRALLAARQRLSLAEGRYQNGSGSVIELGDAQIAASNAAAQVVQTDFQLATARAQLLFALGHA